MAVVGMATMMRARSGFGRGMQLQFASIDAYLAAVTVPRGKITCCQRSKVNRRNRDEASGRPSFSKNQVSCPLVSAERSPGRQAVPFTALYVFVLCVGEGLIRGVLLFKVSGPYGPP